MIKYDISEDNPTGTPSAFHELSILLGMDSFSYLITDDQHRVAAVRGVGAEPPNGATGRNLHHPFLVDALSNDAQLQPTAYRRIRLGWLTPRLTLVPQRLYAESEAHVYLDQLTDLEAQALVSADTVESLRLSLVYAPEPEVAAAAQRHFPGSRRCHLASALLTAWSKDAAARNEPGMYVHVRERDLRIAGLEPARLRFFNSFLFQDTRDFLYYLLLSYAQCDWHPGRFPLYLCGEITADSAIVRQLQRYVGQVGFLAPPDALRLGPRLQSEPLHLHYGLLALHLYG